ncbi:MAG: DNRLRE domain-containing protein [Polyangiaceae bacterium]|nr:DNRLRE domain-containing protein [Polyangiaceae bacterium]
MYTRAVRWLSFFTLITASCNLTDPSSSEDESEQLGTAQQAVWSLPPPSWPPPPEGSTCLTFQRGLLGQVQDTDISQGNGGWIAGTYPFQWTGPSPYSHWALYQFDLSAIPAGAQVVLAVFATSVQWNELTSVVRAHRILTPWTETTANWPNWGNLANWDPTVEGSFNPSGAGYKTVTVTPLVQGWVAGAYPNRGLLLEEDPVVLHGYTSSEASQMNQRPALYVCYTTSGCGPNGSPCDDENVCTTGESCLNGQCQGGTLVTCQAPDECHDDGVCDQQTGNCVPPPKADGSTCDDGNACTENDSCTQGSCGGTALNCDDASACTTDTCNPYQGCEHAQVNCNDGNACTADSCDVTAGCTHSAVTCNDGDACTNDACDPAQGCVTLPVNCDDGVACTVDSCLPAGGCQHVIGCAPGSACAQSFCSNPGAVPPGLAWICNP